MSPKSNAAATTARPSRGRKAPAIPTESSDAVSEDVPAPRTRRTSRRNVVVAPSSAESATALQVSAPRKRGRPPKVPVVPSAQPSVDAAVEATAPENIVRRGRGRPRKIAPVVETQPSSPVKASASSRRGRPSKTSDVANSDVEKAVETSTPEKITVAKEPRRRGRPSKTVSAEAPVPSEAPAKPESADTGKVAKAKTASASRRGPGRPPKGVVAIKAPVEATAEEPAQKKRGRPRKEAAIKAADDAKPDVASATTSRARRGRKPTEKLTSPALPVEANAKPDAASAEIVTVVDAAAAELPDENRPLFSQLGLSEPIMRAIAEMGYEHPTPIQATAIPVVLQGRDVLGVAQTGTGKTASFTLPMLERLAGSRARARMPRSLILEPTRELALQVAENFSLYGKFLRLNHALLIGGESMADQRAVLNQGVDVLIATPGRLIDLFERGGLLLNQTRLLVIDEADRMLDMGFIPDIERIVSLLPKERQTLFFSATMAPEIRKLADAFLNFPEEITVARQSSVAKTIDEALVVVDEHDKRRTLRKLLRHENVQNAIVFCNRKRDVDVLYKSLHKHHFAVGHLHGDLPQSVRTKTLERFKDGELKILVCSDVAARGIDVSGLSHVFNFDLPFHAEDYVHRIGRTGRAGNQGHAFSLATPYQHKLLEAIEALTQKTIAQPVIEGIETLPWAADDERPPSSRDRGSKPGRHGVKPEKKADHRESRPEREESVPVRTDDRPAHAAPARNERRRDDRRHDGRKGHGVAVVEDFELDGPATGFGSETPAFMLLPRRNTPSADGHAGRSGPVQHRGEA